MPNEDVMRTDETVVVDIIYRASTPALNNCREKAEPAKQLQLSHTLAWSELNYMGFCSS